MAFMIKATLVIENGLHSVTDIICFTDKPDSWLIPTQNHKKNQKWEKNDLVIAKENSNSYLYF